MIRVQLGKELRPGVWAYSVTRYGVEAFSRQPLLDACRKLKALGINTKSSVGLFRSAKDSEGRDVPDIACTVGIGAGLSVKEGKTGKPVFVKWVPFDREKTTPKIEEFSQ